MRFTISREKLQEGLAAVAASIPAKTTLPVLANILVETTEKGIRLSGTDLDIAVSTEVAADVESAGAITIPAKKLSESARELLGMQLVEIGGTLGGRDHSTVIHSLERVSEMMREDEDIAQRVRRLHASLSAMKS